MRRILIILCIYYGFIGVIVSVCKYFDFRVIPVYSARTPFYNFGV